MLNYAEQIIEEYDLNLVCGESKPGEPMDRKELLIKALHTANIWATAVSGYSEKPTKKELRKKRKDLTDFVYEKTDMGERPVGFVGSFFWTYVVSKIIGWVVTKMLDKLFKDETQ